MGENYLEQMASDEFFDNVLCPFFGIKVDPIPMNNFANPEYTRAFAEFTHHEGSMFGLSLLIKSVATFAMEHPALVVAGGLAIAGVAIKAITAIVKGIAYKVKYKKLNEDQKEIFALIKDILKDSRRIKKGENGKLLLRDLNITYKIVDYLGKYTTLLSDIKGILIQLQTAVELKDTLQYEKCRLALETIVFDFDKKHDNMLEEDLDLIENNKPAKEVDMNISK